MHLHLHALARSWLRPLFLAVAMLVPIAVVASLTPITEAHAESGRRICRYLWNQGVGNPDRRLVSFVADYKKSGACPAVDRHKVRLPTAVGSWMPPPDNWERHPEPKMTCEQFQKTLTLPSGPGGGDPCTYMMDGMLYAVISHEEDDTASTRRFFDLGSTDKLGY